jgi:aminoglycoside 6'-N-acetyltransferase I
MKVRPVQAEDHAEWLRMRMALWPESESEKEASEIAQFLANPGRSPLTTIQAVFVCARAEGGLCGMAEVGIRPYADGCETNDVGYLEAWYVDPDCRGQGIGRALVRAAEAWAVVQGCREMASDADLENLISQEAHQRLGFVVTGRVVQFVKPLQTDSQS